MLLSRRGYRVLVVDRATFPSDTVSTHVVQPLAVGALARWGLLDRLIATGCPPIHTYTYDFGPVTITGAPGIGSSPVAYCPRRTILDKLLVDAAGEAGAEIREGFTVEEILIEDGVSPASRSFERRTAITNAKSSSARTAGIRCWQAVRPDQYNEKPLANAHLLERIPDWRTFDTYIRPMRGFAIAPTHDGLTLTVGGWPYAEFDANKKDVEGNFLKLFDTVPEIAERVRSAKRVAPIAGAPVSNFFRTPFGPGWALVGDAGYNKDPITAQGINDAFRDAEQVADALDQSFSGARPFDAAMGAYQRARDEHSLAMYEFTCQLATLEPPPPEMQQMLGAIQGNQKAMDAFAQMNAGTILRWRRRVGGAQSVHAESRRAPGVNPASTFSR
jgi:2-polyprenyl-6-methoxyphenol hydroxylase-like FAD-dependent oxidoreductase